MRIKIKFSNFLSLSYRCSRTVFFLNFTIHYSLIGNSRSESKLLKHFFFQEILIWKNCRKILTIYIVKRIHVKHLTSYVVKNVIRFRSVWILITRQLKVAHFVAREMSIKLSSIVTRRKHHNCHRCYYCRWVATYSNNSRIEKEYSLKTYLVVSNQNITINTRGHPERKLRFIV